MTDFCEGFYHHEGLSDDVSRHSCLLLTSRPLHSLESGCFPSVTGEALSGRGVARISAEYKQTTARLYKVSAQLPTLWISSLWSRVECLQCLKFHYDNVLLAARYGAMQNVQCTAVSGE